MTTPQDPLVMTLEEAMREVHFVRLDELREKHGNLADVQVAIVEDGWWVFLNDDGKWNHIEEFGIGEWEAAFSYALGRKVVARDDATELRAATTEYLDARQAWRTSLRGTKAAMRLATAEEALRAALAATEGELVVGAAEVMAAITRYLEDIYDGAPDGHNVMTHDEIREMLDDVWKEISEGVEV